jgi:hypothetical protein
MPKLVTKRVHLPYDAASHLKISGIFTCPCLHGQFTEVKKSLLSIVYINFCSNIKIFVTVMEGIPATNCMLLLSSFTSPYTCCFDVSFFLL